MMPLGLLVAGPVTDATSYQAWFWIAGILNLLIGLGGFFIPAIINIENNRKAYHPATPEPSLEQEGAPATQYGD